MIPEIYFLPLLGILLSVIVDAVLRKYSYRLKIFGNARFKCSRWWSKRVEWALSLGVLLLTLVAFAFGLGANTVTNGLYLLIMSFALPLYWHTNRLNDYHSKRFVKARKSLESGLGLSDLKAAGVLHRLNDDPMKFLSIPVVDEEGNTLPKATLKIQHVGYESKVAFADELRRKGQIRLEKSKSILEMLGDKPANNKTVIRPKVMYFQAPENKPFMDEGRYWKLYCFAFHNQKHNNYGLEYLGENDPNSKSRDIVNTMHSAKNVLAAKYGGNPDDYELKTVFFAHVSKLLYMSYLGLDESDIAWEPKKLLGTSEKPV